MVRHVDCQVLDGSGSLVFEVFDQIDQAVIWLKEDRGDAGDPSGDGGGEHETLQALGTSFLDRVNDLFDIFFEAKVQHLICFVKHRHFEAGKVKVSSFHVIFDASSGSNKNIDSATESPSLVID